MRISGISYVTHKTHRIRRIATIAFSLILAATLVLVMYSAYVGWSLTHPERKDVPAFTSKTTPTFSDVSFTDIEKSLTLNGWFFKSGDSNRAVIIAHGYGQNRLQFKKDAMINMVKRFISSGYNVLLFDFRNSGKSEGNLTSVGIYEKEDMLGAVNYVKSLGSKQIILMGFSMGASTSIITAAESPDVSAVIADSPFSDLTEYLNKNLPAWSHLPAFPFNKTILFSTRLLTGLDTSKVSPEKAMGSIAPRPVLLIHSKDDIKIPVADSKKLLNAASEAKGSNVELWETSGVDHVGSYEKNPGEYMDRVLEFLSKSLPSKNN